MLSPIGLYLHIPFCEGKCPYCDFYSRAATRAYKDAYTGALIRSMRDWAKRTQKRADTLYIGGGTPVLLGRENLIRVIGEARQQLCEPKLHEATVEVNPNTADKDTLRALRDAGINRLSVGMQSANEEELRALGRRHSFSQVQMAVADAKAAGFSNISVDLMIGLPGQTCSQVEKSVRAIEGLCVQHVSAYLLKVEEGTPYAIRGVQPAQEDMAADLYMLACKRLEAAGFSQYEISNFALPGYESRHNLKYWDCAEYLGLGPAAHSFLNGRRFYYPRDLDGFIAGCEPKDDGPGGDMEEYVMLRLRLAQGLLYDAFEARFEIPLPAEIRQRAESPKMREFIEADVRGIRLTRQGFLVSNAVIGYLLEG